MKVVFSVVGLAGALWVPAVLAGCQDPCIELAQRICNCEPTVLNRRQCVTDRITGQQGNVDISDTDRELCVAKLETCSCAALDQNDLDACGFVPAAADGSTP
jgi:hypothetical protein